jgi:hypothetical protein
LHGHAFLMLAPCWNTLSLPPKNVSLAEGLKFS